MVRSRKIPKSVIDSGRNLELIIRAGVGFDNIDIAAAAKKNIKVENVPGKNVHAVSELVIALAFHVDRKVYLNDQASKNNQWNKAQFSKSKGLRNQTLGIIGLGKIGINVAKTALAIGMKVIVFTIDLKVGTILYPFGTKEKSLSIEVVPFENVLKNSDIITLHVPSNKHTKNMICQKNLSLMKKEILLINTSRNTVVNEGDLINHLNANPKFRVATDVLDDEPSFKKGALNSKLGRHPQVVSTHHIGAGTAQATFAVGDGLYNQLALFVKKGKIVNCVNFPSQKL